MNKNQGFEDYKHTQIGYSIIVIFSLAMLLQVILLLSTTTSLPQAAWVIFLIINIFVLGIGSLFSSLTIKLEQGWLVWHFSFLFWNRMLKVNEIASCLIVRNAFFDGLGIRIIGNGWLYNVSGLDAVQINLRNGDTIRLGTDQPQALCAALEARMRDHKI